MSYVFTKRLIKSEWIPVRINTEKSILQLAQVLKDVFTMETRLWNVLSQIYKDSTL